MMMLITLPLTEDNHLNQSSTICISILYVVLICTDLPTFVWLMMKMSWYHLDWDMILSTIWWVYLVQLRRALSLETYLESYDQLKASPYYSIVKYESNFRDPLMRRYEQIVPCHNQRHETWISESWSQHHLKLKVTEMLLKKRKRKIQVKRQKDR